MKLGSSLGMPVACTFICTLVTVRYDFRIVSIGFYLVLQILSRSHNARYRSYRRIVMWDQYNLDQYYFIPMNPQISLGKISRIHSMKMSMLHGTIHLFWYLCLCLDPSIVRVSYSFLPIQNIGMSYPIVLIP